MIALLVQILAIFFGWLVIRQLAWSWRRGEIFAASIVVGYVVAAYLFFVFALLLGWQIALPGTTLLLVFLSFTLWRQPPRYTINRKQYIRNRWQRLITWLTVLGATLAVANLVVLSYQFPATNGAWYSNGNVWGDGPLHVTLINQFAHGDAVDLLSPFYKKSALSYPFIADFWSGVLMRTTDSWFIGLTIPSLLMTLSLLQLLFSFANRLLGSARAALFSWLMIVFSGSLYAGIKMTNVLAVGGIEAYHNFIGVSIPYATGENYLNFFHSHILPQRAFLFGMPLLILVLTGLLEAYRYWVVKKDKLSRFHSILLILGALGGLLPLVHAHSFVVLVGLLTLMMAGIWTWTKKPPREWLIVLGVLIIFAAPQLAWQFGTTYFSGFGHWISGWMMSNFQETTNDFWLWFWVRNIGWLFVVLAFGWYWLKRQRAKPEIWLVYVAGVALFMIANLYVFQPTYWDNMKFFEYALWFIMLVSALLFANWSRTKAGLIVTCTLTVSLTLTGFYTLILSGSKLTFELLRNNDVLFGLEVRKQLPTSAYILTSGRHNHPVTMLGGGKVLVSYDGWYNLYGNQWPKTIQDRETMLRGIKSAKELIFEYGLTHVIFSEEEVASGIVNKEFFDTNYKLISSRYGWYVYSLQ